LWRGSSCRSCRCICNRTWKIEWQQLKISIQKVKVTNYLRAKHVSNY
jgi:hypothetical protein